MNIIGIVHVKKFKIFPLKNDININIVTTIICNIDSKDLFLKKFQKGNGQLILL